MSNADPLRLQVLKLPAGVLPSRLSRRQEAWGDVVQRSCPPHTTVNVVQPGVMPSDTEAAVLGAGASGFLASPLQLHPIRRIARLEAVSAVVGYPTSPQAAYMTGSVIDVAGGLGI